MTSAASPSPKPRIRARASSTRAWPIWRKRPRATLSKFPRCLIRTKPRSAVHSTRIKPSSPTPQGRARRCSTSAWSPSPKPRIRARAPSTRAWLTWRKRPEQRAASFRDAWFAQSLDRRPYQPHKAVVADATRQSVEMFDARLDALSEAADQSARVIDSSLADMAEAANRNAQQVSALLDVHKASIGAAFDSHKAVVADVTRESAQMFDERLAALSVAADQSARFVDARPGRHGGSGQPQRPASFRDARRAQGLDRRRSTRTEPSSPTPQDRARRRSTPAWPHSPRPRIKRTRD